MKGPLQGLRIIEMAGIGPAPFCAMMLADMGAEILRIQRPQPEASAPRENRQFDVMARGRRALTLDLHAPGGAALVLDLLDSADVLIEGFRPGVMERLGLGPDICLARRPGLIYGRMTGWGQSGPLSACAGHDINYIALSGALHAIGREGQGPTLPLNYIGDFGGGGMMLAFGILCAVLEARQSGQGQVVDAAMSDGAALLSSMMYGMHADGKWSNQRGDNLLDGGAHFYNTYACADGKHIALGAIEPQFYKLLLERCGIDAQDPLAQMDTGKWPELKCRFADLFRTRTRQQWCALLEGTDACFAPVLDWDEAPQHPHNQARKTFVTIDGVVQPAPAPRFSRTPPATPASTEALAADAQTVLREWKCGAAARG
ncbi:MAG TPA: CaiB/BaiF CoA-transferase family protein [Rhodocyclaceae bacterium]|nr:CaiB/BaiF CoA-transferase family protein [Rhodocyclaceae bacterium]